MRHLLILFLLVVGSGSFAQSVTVRAGEHQGFTRVVLRVPDGLDWQIGRTETGYGLRLSEPVTFETSSFFTLIPKDRISAVVPQDEGAQLNFDLNCDCAIDAYLTETQWLVIDISSQAPSPDSIFQTPLFDANIPADESRDDLPEQQGQTITEMASEPLQSVMVEVETFSDVLPIAIEVPADESGLTGTTIDDRFEESRRLAQLETAVSDSLSRAISQGLLQPAAPDQSPDPEQGLTALDQLLVDVAQLRGPGVAARTSVDGDSTENLAQLTISPNEHQCGDPSLFDVPNWGADEPFAEQVAMRRNGLIGEFDRPDPEAIEDLARLYIFFGFGREAKAALKIDSGHSKSRLVLGSLAEIIDGDPLTERGFIENLHCAGPLHFWGMLAHNDGPLPAVLDPASIVQTFQSLPTHLQRHLAPRVAEKLRQAGQNDSARIILQSATDGPDVTIEAQLETSALLDAIGEEEEAISTLKTATTDDPRVTPEILAKLIELKIREDEPVLDSEIDLLTTLKFESADPAVSEQLATLEIRAIRHQGKPEEALRILDKARTRSQSQEFEDLEVALLQDIVQAASNVDFLELALNRDLTGLAPNLQNSFASRLIELGFPDASQPLLMDQTNGEAMMERRYLRAELAIIQNNDELVLAHLAGMETDRAKEIRGKIDHSSATQKSSAQSSQSIDHSETLTVEPVGQIAGQNVVPAREPSINPIESSTPLSASTELIDQSADLRLAVIELLKNQDAP